MNDFSKAIQSFSTPRPARFLKFRWTSLSAAFCIASCLAGAQPSHAVVLRQKWVAGQQLAYDMTTSGTMTLLDDDDSPQPWAGLPMDFRVRGSGAALLDTVSVDEGGIGTVIMRGGDSNIRAMGLGQTMEFSIKNGFATALMNGQPVEGGMEKYSVADPSFALKLGPQGRLEGTLTLRPNEKKNETMPFDFASSLQSWMLQSVPSLWPQGDVKEGDSWTAPLNVPLPAKENSTARETVNAGQVKFTLRGVEDAAGRKAQRVSFTGGFDINAAKAKIFNDAAQSVAKEAAQKTPPNSTAKKLLGPKQTRNLADATEKISGDLWLDVESGQLVRASVAAQGKMHTQGTITNKAGRTRPTETWLDFDGSVQLQLRRVSYSSAAPASLK